MDVFERGMWQLCHVRRLAFYFDISFYLMQHTPLLRSINLIRISCTLLSFYHWINLYMILLSFVMLLLNSVFSPIISASMIYWYQHLASFKKLLKIFSSRDVFDVFSSILWRCNVLVKLKLQHPPPPGILRAFDTFAILGRSLPGGGKFEP